MLAEADPQLNFFQGERLAPHYGNVLEFD